MRILVTGGTGFLGSEVLPRLLDDGWDVVALTRQARRSEQPRLRYIQGSVTGALPRCGPLDCVLNMAAFTSLGEKNRPRMYRINTLATENVAYFCRSRRLPLFHVSTLYVAGDHRDTFEEKALDVGQGFKNLYEESKFAAERYLRACRDLGVCVLRPGILVGRYSDGYTAFFEGFYRPIRAIVAAHQFAEGKLGLPPRHVLEQRLHLPRLRLPIKILGDPNSTMALTPVDFAAQVIVEAVRTGRIGHTVHVAPSRVPKNREVASAVRAALHLEGLEFSRYPRASPVSMVYNRLIRDFLPYMRDEPRFPTSVGHDCPAVNEGFLERILTYWRRHGDTGLGHSQGPRRAAAVGRHADRAHRSGAPAAEAHGATAL